MAAGEYVAKLPYVDPDRVFLVGYNIGGILTTLASMVPSPYRAAAAFDADLEMKAWARQEGPHIIVFDRNNAEEVRLRDPYSFVSSLRIPLTLYSTRSVEPRNRDFVNLARNRNKTCEYVPVVGNLTTMLGPAVKLAIARFQTK